MWAIIPLSGIFYRLGGSEYGNKWYRWLMGLPIGIIMAVYTQKLIYIPIYTATYFIATSVFVYGDDSWVSKLLGRKGARIAHGIAFGLASLQPLFAIWTAVVFYILFELAEHDVIDNKVSEALRGSLGVLIFCF